MGKILSALLLALAIFAGLIWLFINEVSKIS